MKTQIYAPRLVGDIDLGLEPSRLGGDDRRAWARMTFPGRRIPGQPDQTIYEAGTTTQKFELGTRRIEYGRTFRYSKAGGAIATFGVLFRLLANANYVPDAAGHADEDGFIGNPYVQVEVNAKYVDLDTSETFAANFFQGGYISSFVSPYKTQYIVASDLGDGTSCRVYLDSPATVVIPTAQTIEVYPSPYSNVIDSVVDSSFISWVGLMNCPALTTGQFFWLQTQGPCWICPTHWDSNYCPGYAGNSRDVYAMSDGAIRSATGADPSTGFQRIGYLLSRTVGGYGSVHIMLQLE